MGHPSRLGLIDSQEPVERDHPLNQGLVAWWLGLPNNSGGGTLFDLLGRYPGTLTNGPTWSPGPHGFMGVTTNGTNSCISGTQPFNAVPNTLCAFFKPNALTSNPSALVSVGVFSSINAYTLSLNTTGTVSARMQSDRQATTANATAVGRTSFAAARFLSDTNRSAYLDFGTIATDTGAKSSNGATGAFTAGRASDSNSWFFSGDIYSVWAYNRALSDDELRLLNMSALLGHPDTLRRYSTAAWFVPPAAGGGSGGARRRRVLMGGR